MLVAIVTLACSLGAWALNVNLWRTARGYPPPPVFWLYSLAGYRALMRCTPLAGILFPASTLLLFSRFLRPNLQGSLEPLGLVAASAVVFSLLWYIPLFYWAWPQWLVPPGMRGTGGYLAERRRAEFSSERYRRHRI